MNDTYGRRCFFFSSPGPEGERSIQGMQRRVVVEREACLSSTSPAAQITEGSVILIVLIQFVLVHSSCYNKSTIDWVAYKQQKRISHTLEAGKSKINVLVNSESGEGWRPCS